MHLFVRSTRLTVISLIFLAAALAGVAIAQDAPRGHLVIVGGGKRGREIMRRYIQLAGGERSSCVVFPMASALADSMEAEETSFLKKVGAGTVRYLNINRRQADSDSVLRLLDSVSSVFFTGGDQSRLTAVLQGTATERRLQELYRNGAVIGGTSAGAAVMSRVMITGDERLNRDSTNAYWFIRGSNVVTSEGFGFLEDVIIDQHFIRRKRHNRLISLVLEHPQLLGVGIDESTAIVVNPDRTFDVVGDATVLVLDASHAAVSKDPHGNLAGSGIQMHLLKAGDRFDLAARTVLSPDSTR